MIVSCERIEWADLDSRFALPSAQRLIRATIASAKGGDDEALETLRSVIRAWADTGYPHEVIALAEALCDVRAALQGDGEMPGPASA